SPCSGRRSCWLRRWSATARRGPATSPSRRTSPPASATPSGHSGPTSARCVGSTPASWRPTCSGCARRCVWPPTSAPWPKPAPACAPPELSSRGRDPPPRPPPTAVGKRTYVRYTHLVALPQRAVAEAPARADLRELNNQARPVSLAGERTLPVLPALASLLPEGGLRRGSTVAVSG